MPAHQHLRASRAPRSELALDDPAGEASPAAAALAQPFPTAPLLFTRARAIAWSVVKPRLLPFRCSAVRGTDRGQASVSAERVALIPQCEECRKVWLPAEGTGGWPTGSTTALKIASLFGARSVLSTSSANEAP